MTKYSFKTSTAILMALSIVHPHVVVAQDEFPEGAICADGVVPPCADGVELILSGATCADGATPPCAEGVELILPETVEDAVEEVVPSEVPEEVVEEAVTAIEESTAEDDSSVAEEVAEEMPPKADEAMTEPVATDEVVAEPEVPVEEAAPVEEMAAPVEAEVVEEKPAEEEMAAPAEVSEEAPTEEAAPVMETATPEEAPTEATPAVEEATSEPMPVEETVVEEMAPEISEPEVAEEVTPEPPATEEVAAEVEEDAPEEAATETEAPVSEPTATEVAEPEVDSSEPVEEVAETEETEETEEDVTEEVQAEDTVEAASTEEVAETTEPEAEPVEETVVVAPGAEENTEEAEKVLELLGDLEDAAQGESEAGAVAAAVSEDQGEIAETLETAITAEESRQSTEEFATRAIIGEAPPVNASGDRGLSDLEKGALIGLGILAAGAVLSNGDEVVSNSGDRVVVRRGEDDFYVLKDDDALLRQPGSTVRTERFNDGSTRTTVTREDGVKIITIRNASGRVLRRVREDTRGRQVVLIDDIATYEPVELEKLPAPVSREVVLEGNDPMAISIALERAAAAPTGRAFSLRQIREIEQVRKLVPEIALDDINFALGSAAIDTSQAKSLIRIGDLIKVLIEDNPGEVFLIEGHTDATGSASFNLALSDRRAESFALALTEYFGVLPENLVVQGYGESDLKIDTEADEVRNRRVTVRRITPLLDQRMARQ